MILTTQQQAQNFVLYVLDHTSYFEGLSDEALLAGLMREVGLVFGNHTFSDEALTELIEQAIDTYDNRDY